MAFGGDSGKMIAMLRHVAEKETCIGYEYFFINILFNVLKLFLSQNKKRRLKPPFFVC